MALFGKDDKPQRPDDVRPFVVGTPPRPNEPPPSEESVQAHLGKGSRIEGKLTFEGSVRLDGHIDGEIEAQETLIIGESAIINAQISAGTVIVKGKVNGDIAGRKRVELRAPGKLIGNITTPSLVIHEGVVFEGHCSMGGAADAKTEKVDKDKKVTLFPKEERTTNSVRMPSEAIK
jgi:cytoskeletal protein CcmA (bactofilin family)